MKNNNRGFTLIELLVVISIIGILASVVLVASTNSRNKSKDARVISDIQQARISFQYGFSNPVYRDLYGAPGQLVTGGTLTDSATSPSFKSLSALSADIAFLGSTINYMIQTNSTPGNATSPNAIAFAVYGRLVSDQSRYFCMDSTGKTSLSTSTNTMITCY